MPSLGAMRSESAVANHGMSEIPSPDGDAGTQAETLSADIFISYSRKDIAFARLIRTSLESAGLETWIDWARIPVGERWRDEISQAIERSNVFLFIISRSSTESSICRDEINEALKNHKRIVPVLVDDLTPEVVHRFVPELPEINWVVFEKDRLFQIAENDLADAGAPEDRLVALPKLPQFEEAMGKLSEAIHTDWEWVKSHTQLQVDALRWSNRGGDASYLLRGSELADAEAWLSSAAGRDPQPTLLQSQFITASRLEETRRQRQNSRRQRWLLWAIGSALVITAVLGSVAFVQRSEARRQATAVLSGELAAESSNNLNTRFDLASLLAVESWNTLDSVTSRSSLLSALLARPRLETVFWTRNELTSVAFSPDGRLLAGAYCAASNPVNYDCTDYAVGLWNTADRKPAGPPLPQQRGPLAFTPDGKGLITRTAQGRFVTWNLALRRTQGPVFSGSEAWTTSLVLNRDATVLAAGGCVEVSGGLCSGGHLVVWSYPGGRLLFRTANVNATDQKSIAFSPDGSLLAWSGCAVKGKTKSGTAVCVHGSVVTLDTASGRTAEHPVGRDVAVVGVAFSPDGATLAALDASGSGVLLDVASWKQIAAWKGSPAGVGSSLIFGHDGATLAVTAAGQPVTLLNGRNAEQLDQFSIGSSFFDHASLALDPRGNVLADSGCYQYDHSGFLCEQGAVLIWDIEPQPPPGRAYLSTGATLGRTYLSPDGTRAARSRCVSTKKADDGTSRCTAVDVEVVDVATGKLSGPPLRGLPSELDLAAFDATGDRLVTVTCSKWDGRLSGICEAPNLNDVRQQIDVWNVPSGRRVRPSLVSSGMDSDIALAPDGRTLMLSKTAGLDRLDLATGQSAAVPLPSRQTKSPLMQSLLAAMAFSGNGTRLVAATCTKYANFQDPFGSCQTTRIRIWDTATWTTSGKPIVLTADLSKGGDVYVDKLLFSPDGSELAIATASGIRFWDFGKERFSGKSIPTSLVASIAYAHNGKQLAVAERGDGDSGNSITLWDLAQMQPLEASFRDEGGEASLVFSKDDTTLISSSGLLWDTDPAAWKARVCEMAGRDFTTAEWAKYLGFAYHETCR